MKISSILATKSDRVYTIDPEETVLTAVRRLTEHRIGALPVIGADGRLIGILSERDILWRVAEDEAVLTRPVRELMTRQVVVCLPEDDVVSAMNTMTERRFRHLPVMVDGRLIGLVSIGDLLKAQRDAFRGEIDTLETQILAGN